MPYEERPNSGALFSVKNPKSDRAPQFNGKIRLDVHMLKELVDRQRNDGVAEIEIALWERHGERAGKFFSAKISPAYRKPEGGRRQNEIPFPE